MKDYLIKGIAYNDQVRICACRTENTLNEIGKRMGYYPSALDALGRVLNMGVMMGSMLGPDQSVTLKVDGNGPIGEIRVDADPYGHVRAFAENPRCHFEYANTKKLNVKATIGTEGYIKVIKDLKLKEPYVGTSPIVDGEIAKDFAYYFAVSEQIPTSVSLGIIVDTNNEAKVTGGFIVQLLPFTKEETIDELEKRLNDLPPMSQLLSEGKTLEEIVLMIAPDYKNTDYTDVEFQCNCSKERFKNGLVLLKKEEIKEMIEQDGGAETVCPFCNNKYYFNKEELEEIAKIAK